MKIVKYALIIVLVVLIGGFIYFMNRTPASPFKIEEFHSNLSLNLPNVKFSVESNNTVTVNYEKES